LNPDRWSESVAYCYAIDLFNSGYYWEAHEVWEWLWREAGRVGIVADFLKGLIKLAAGLVKAREGRREGVGRHSRRAAELFAAVQASCRAQHRTDHIGGLSLDGLIALADQIAQDAPSISLESPPGRPDDPPSWLGTYRLEPAS
jgi:predicted metal-dependent hydrolase